MKKQVAIQSQVPIQGKSNYYMLYYFAFLLMNSIKVPVTSLQTMNISFNCRGIEAKLFQSTAIIKATK